MYIADFAKIKVKINQYEESEESESELEEETKELPSSRGSMVDGTSQKKKGSKLGQNLFITYLDAKNCK